MINHRPDELGALRAEFDTFRASVERRERRRCLPRRLLPVALAVLLVALVPFATLAANPFNDLNPNSVHNGNIDAIYNAGITTGCDPNVSYCPNDSVTREEMASFLARTAGLGGNPPIANAKTAQMATSATNATTAQNALALGGQPPSYYQAAGQPVASANTVGGYAPNGLVRVGLGYAETTTSSEASSVTQTAQITAPARGFVLVTATSMPFTFSGGTVCPCTAFARLYHVQGNAFSPTMSAFAPYRNGSTGTSITVTWVFPVVAGQQTFQLRTDAGPLPSRNPTITLLYIPFGSTGGTTLETTP